MRCKSLDKTMAKHRKGLWSPEEDQRLRNYVLKHGHARWSSVPINAGLHRSGKSCRLRWLNYLRPGLKLGTFSSQEEETILTLHGLLGNKWSQIAKHMPGRTDNEVKNYWHSHLKKKILKAEGNNTQSASSNSENMQILSFESSENVKTLSAHTDQSVSHFSVDFPEEPNRVSSLPKLMFAEWLSIDNSASLGDNSTVSKGAPLDHNQSCYHHNCLSDTFASGQSLGNEFVDVSLAEIFDEFNLFSDVMYI